VHPEQTKKTIAILQVVVVLAASSVRARAALAIDVVDAAFPAGAYVAPVGIGAAVAAVRLIAHARLG
jgi:hypothetical protein